MRFMASTAFYVSTLWEELPNLVHEVSIMSLVISGYNEDVLFGCADHFDMVSTPVRLLDSLLEVPGLEA